MSMAAWFTNEEQVADERTKSACGFISLLVSLIVESNCPVHLYCQVPLAGEKMTAV
jgi:hypothetical protein